MVCLKRSAYPLPGVSQIRVNTGPTTWLASVKY